MARTNQPSAATQRTTATTPMDADGPGSFDAHDQQGESSQGESNRVGDNAERRENLTAVQDKPDNGRDDSRENRDDSREYRRESRGGREFGESREERTQHDGYTEQGSRREQPPISAGLDAFTPVLEAWKQVFKSWSELAQTMVKAQQDAFANMISAANTTATNINVGDLPDSELAFSGSRPTTSTPDRIERDRR